MSEMTAAQFKLAQVVDNLVCRSPLFGGDLVIEPLPGGVGPGEGVRVDWNDTNLDPQRFEIRVHEIESCKDMDTAIRVILDKMRPGHTLRRTQPLTPDRAPAYTPSIDPRQVFEQRVVACELCETLGGFAALLGSACPESGCGGTLAAYRIVQPKIPGIFKPFKERIPDEEARPGRSTRPDRPGVDRGDGPPG